MKVARVNILISPTNNTHKQFLYNEVLDFVRREKVGAEFRTQSIKVNSVPEPLLTVLEKSKIIFNKLLDK